MYPPPSIETIFRLRGNVLEVISFGKYTIHLGFENGNRLSISAPFRFAKKAIIPVSPVFEFPILESTLMQLLWESVADCQCDTDGTLELVFSNDDMLIVYANDPQYEAYTLLIDGKEYVI